MFIRCEIVLFGCGSAAVCTSIIQTPRTRAGEGRRANNRATTTTTDHPLNEQMTDLNQSLNCDHRVQQPRIFLPCLAPELHRKA